VGMTTWISRRALFPAILLGMVLGAFAGLAAGWFVWPVAWYDTDPSDLRLRHQISYVAMVADSYTVTGDLKMARERLYELMDEDTTWAQVANLVVRVSVALENEGDGEAAQRVRRLYNDVGMPSPAKEEFTLGLKQPSDPSLWVGLGVVGAVGLASLIWLAAASRSAPAEQFESDEGYDEWVQAESPVGGKPAEPPTNEVPPATAPANEGNACSQMPDDLNEEDWEEVLTTTAPEGQAGPSEPEPSEYQVSDQEPHGRPERGDWSEPEARVSEEGEAPGAGGVPGSVAEPSGGREASEGTELLGIFEAEYRFGDRDFDCSFTIEPESGGFLGECGVGVADVLSAEDTRQVEAFEVWLFDKADIRTVSAVLVSEKGQQDEALLERLAGKGELLVARPGLEVRLQTLSLQVTATVRSCAYTEEGDGGATYFEHLRIALRAERIPEAT